MHDDERERSVQASRLVDHLLEDRAIVIERRRSRLTEDFDDVPPLALTVCATLGHLVGQREITFGLPSG
jgi:hypothetical protein